jgi:tetratricopeptide (TPR) repeat protein
MTEVNSTTVQSTADFYAGEDKKRLRDKEKVTPIYAYSMILVAMLVVGTMGYGFGKYFFWERYRTDPFYERQYETVMQRVQADPQNPDNLVALGWIFFQQGDYNKAVAEFDKAMTIDREHFAANFNLGIAYMQVEKFDQAVRAFRNIIEFAPRDYATRLNLGICYMEIERPEDALQQFQIAYNLRPGTAETLNHLAKANETLGNTQEALTHYQAVLNFDPKNADAQAGISRLAAN